MLFLCFLHIASDVALMLILAFLGPILVPTWPLQGRFWAPKWDPKRDQKWDPKKDLCNSAGTKNFFKNSLGLAGAFRVLLIPCLHFVRISLCFRPIWKGLRGLFTCSSYP